MDDEPSTLERHLKTQPEVVEDTSETLELGRGIAFLTLVILVVSLFTDVSVYVMIAAYLTAIGHRWVELRGFEEGIDSWVLLAVGFGAAALTWLLRRLLQGA